jgi:hypothetical protein
MNVEVECYRKHKNLKIAAQELGIPWQSLYVRLKKLGEPVTGDKLRYGTDRDRLGVLAEQEFKRLVPFAIDNNLSKFQANYDFTVGKFKIDVKASLPKQKHKRFAALSWSFSLKKQTLICDFVCCFCLSEEKEIEHILLVPSEFFKGIQTVSVSRKANSKWLDYSIPAESLLSFFSEMQ